MFTEIPFAIAKNDITQMLFPSNNSIVIGENLLTYESSFNMMESLKDVTLAVVSASEDSSKHLVPFVVSAKHINPDSIRNSAKTVEEMLDEALAYYKEVASKASTSYGKLAHDQPAFLYEMYSLADALQVAIQGSGADNAVSREVAEKDIFNFFIADLGYWWIVDLCGLKNALSFLERFFDAFYPLLKDKGKRADKRLKASVPKK